MVMVQLKDRFASARQARPTKLKLYSTRFLRLTKCGSHPLSGGRAHRRSASSNPFGRFGKLGRSKPLFRYDNVQLVLGILGRAHQERYERLFPSDLGQILYTFIEQLKRHVSVRYILLYTVTRGRSEDWLSPSFINRLDPEYGPSFLEEEYLRRRGLGLGAEEVEFDPNIDSTLVEDWEEAPTRGFPR